MTDANENPYAALGLNRAATLDEIKQAYFNQVRQHPPEREPDAFKRIRAAYDQLKTPEKRVEADMRLLEDFAPAKAGASARAARLPELDLTGEQEALHPARASGSGPARFGCSLVHREQVAAQDAASSTVS